MPFRSSSRDSGPLIRKRDEHPGGMLLRPEMDDPLTGAGRGCTAYFLAINAQDCKKLGVLRSSSP